MEPLVIKFLFKRCTRCHRELPIQNFRIKRTQCHECEIEYKSISRRKRGIKKMNVGKTDLLKGTRVCSKCKKELEFSFFAKNNKARDGINAWCKECTNEWHRNYFHKSKEYREEKKKYARKRRQLEEIKEKERERSRLYGSSERGKLTGLLRTQKRRMIKKRVTISQVPKEKIIDMFSHASICPLCKKPFNTRRKKTLDHVIPLAKGGEHTLSNFQILCSPCNTSKGDKLVYLC